MDKIDRAPEEATATAPAWTGDPVARLLYGMMQDRRRVFGPDDPQARRLALAWGAVAGDVEREAKMQRPDVITGPELCALAGLTPIEFDELREAGLLRPTAEPQLYRRRLVEWAKKLAYLLAQGWTLDEIRVWSKTRFEGDDPRQWPPQRPQRIAEPL